MHLTSMHKTCSSDFENFHFLDENEFFCKKKRKCFFSLNSWPISLLIVLFGASNPSAQNLFLRFVKMSIFLVKKYAPHCKFLADHGQSPWSAIAIVISLICRVCVCVCVCPTFVLSRLSPSILDRFSFCLFCLKDLIVF